MPRSADEDPRSTVLNEEDPPQRPDGLADFVLGRELGSGSTGTVYLATVRRPFRGVKAGDTVAVKFLHQRLLGDPAARRRFLREARAGLGIRHRNLVQVHSVEEAEVLGSRILYLAMEWVEGPTLRDLLREGGLAEPLVRSIGAQVARGLAALHATGVVHHDVKPENVVLAEGGRAVLMDLGFARSMQPSTESEREEARSFAGSLAYAAPERLRNQLPTPQSDLYSLGALLYELATGERPFPGDDITALIRGHLEGPIPLPSSKVSRISRFLDAVVNRCLEKDPAHRFATATELANVLERAEGSPFWRERLAERAPDATPELRRAHLTTFHGRDDELRELGSELARSAAGSFRVVEIRGDAGTGKTRLVDEFVVRATEGEDPPLPLYGRCPRVGDPTPAEPFLAMLERYLVLPRGKDPDAAAARRLRALLPSSSSVVLLDTLRAPRASAPIHSLARAFAAFVEAIAAEQPVVAFVDDADKADPATVEVLRALCELAPPRTLLVLGRRPESSRVDSVVEYARGRASLSTIGLDPLSSHAVSSIVADLIEPGPRRIALRDALVRTTAGNPGHVAEAIRTLRASGALVPVTSAERLGAPLLHVAKELSTIPVPSSLADAIRARLQGLDADERRAAELVAVAGDHADVELLVSAFGGDRMGWLRTLSRLESQHAILASRAGTFRFARPIVREVLYEWIDSEDRRGAHGALARALDGRLGENASDRDRLRVAEHARRSSEADLALKHLPRLAEDFRRRGLFERALLLARATLDLLNERPRRDHRLLGIRFDALATTAECFSRLGRRVEERRSLEKGARIARFLADDARLARTLLSLGRLAHATGRYLVASSYLDRAIELAHRAGAAREEADAALAKAAVVSYAGDIDAAGELIERALARATDGDVRARALLQQGLRSLNLDRPDLALALLDEAHTSFRELRMPAAQASAHFHRARAYADLGRITHARRDLDRALSRARESGERRTEASTLSLRGSIRASLKDFDGADRDLRAALAIAGEIGDRFTECHTALHLANALLAGSNPRADLREALRLARLGLSIAEEIDLARLRALALAVRARVHLRASRMGDALVESERALVALEEGPSDRRRQVAVWFTRGEVLREAGRLDESRQWIDRAARRLRETAERIPVELRRGFLEEEPFHRKVLASANAIAIEGAGDHSGAAPH